MVLDVEGRPKDMNTWKDSDGAAYDAACTAVTEALMGGTHPEVEILADSDFDAATVARRPRRDQVGAPVQLQREESG